MHSDTHKMIMNRSNCNPSELEVATRLAPQEAALEPALAS